MEKMALSLKTVEWKIFPMIDIFDIKDGYYNKKPPIESYGKIPFLGATQYNNCITGFCNIESILKYNKTGDIDSSDKNKRLFQGNCIAITNNGSVGNAYYQREEFTCSHDVTPIYLRNTILNKHIAIFLIPLLQNSGQSFEYGKKWRPKRMRKSHIMLPVDSKGTPNWQFMEDYMKQQEYKLLQKVQKRFAGKVVSSLITRGSLSQCKWKEFYFTEVFDEIQRGKRLTKAAQLDGNMPYIFSTASNNGVDGFIGNLEKVRTFEDCITLANSGSVGNAFFQAYKFVASDHVTKLKVTGLDKHAYLFMLPIINRLSEKYSFNREINDERIKREKILLPITENGNIDFEFMSSFIKSIEVENIKKVLDIYAQRIENQKIKWGVKWTSYFIEDVAEIISGRDIYERERIYGDTPYITATANQNGIGYFVGNENITLEEKCLSVNRNGSVGYAFYHPYQALFSNDCRKLRLKKNSKNVGLFIAQQITIQRDKYGYGYKMGTGRLKRQMIMLPSCKNGEPNYAFMESYIEELEMKQIIQYLKYSDYRNIE